MKVFQNIEIILSSDSDGIWLNIYKKYPTNKLIRIDYSVEKDHSFILLKNMLEGELKEVSEGMVLYYGKDVNLNKMNSLLKQLGYKVGIDKGLDLKNREERIESLEGKLLNAVEEEEYMEAAKIRDEIARLKDI